MKKKFEGSPETPKKGAKQTFIAKEAIEIAHSEMRESKQATFVCSLPLLRKKIKEQIGSRKIFLKFNSMELLNALVRSEQLRRQVAIIPSREGVIDVTIYANEIMLAYESIKHLASDNKPHFAQQKTAPLQLVKGRKAA